MVIHFYKKNFIIVIKKLLGYGYESNVYLIMDERNALIDAGTGFETKNLIKEIGKYTRSIDYIILTHEHFDHCGGAAPLKRFFGSKIAMHEDGSRILEEGSNIYSSFFNAKFERAKVDIRLKGREIIDLGRIKLKVIHTPGHSPGSICLYDEKNKILFSGDTIFLYGGVGRTDFYGGDKEKLKESIKKIARLNIESLYPGHGEYAEKNASIHIKLAFQNLSLL